MDWDTIYEDLKVRNWVILLILSSLSYFLLSPTQTLGTIIGGFLVIANFKIFQHTLHEAFCSGGQLKTKRISIILKFYFRLLALGLIMAVLIVKEWVDPVGLAIGLSTVVIAITFLGVSMALKTKGKEAS